MRKKKTALDTTLTPFPVAEMLAELALNLDDHTESQISGALTEAIEIIIAQKTNSMAREDTFFALLRLLADAAEENKTIVARAASIAFSFTDWGTDAEIKTWYRFAGKMEVAQ
jgi:hypothetical protein